MIFGIFNDKVTIQEKRKVSNGRGGWSEKWETVKDVYVNIQPMARQEIVEYRKAQVKVDTKIFMKYDPTFPIHTECQLLTPTKAYEIESVTNPQNKNEMFEIVAVGVDI